VGARGRRQEPGALTMLRIDGVEELRAAAAAFSAADKATRDGIKAEARKFGPILQRAAERRAAPLGPIEAAVARSGRVAANARGITAVFGSTGSFKGEHLSTFAGPWEFGGNRDKVTKYVSRHRISKKAMVVARHASRQIPRRTPDGRFIYQAVGDTTPTLVSMWVRAVAKAVL
jgi:hypothetical protein